LFASFCPQHGGSTGDLAFRSALGALCLRLLDLLLVRERARLLKRVALIRSGWRNDRCFSALFLCRAESFLVAAVLIFALVWLKLPPESGS
jgi:hypothetical protein